MRNGQNKRMRNRNRKGQNPMTRVYESNGPEVKIRGTASHIAEKYLQLARDAQGSGDPVGAENYYQHAEHYFRIIAAAQEQFRQSQPSFYRNEGGEMRDDAGDDVEGDDNFQPYGEPFSPQPNYPQQQREQPYPRNEGGYQQRPQPQPQQGGADNGDIDRLPSFITGAQPQPDINGGNGNGNGYHQDRGDRGDRGGDRGERGDRFNHRRRRRHHSGPRNDNHNQAPNGGDFADNAGE
jgi:hypothetical protein